MAARKKLRYLPREIGGNPGPICPVPSPRRPLGLDTRACERPNYIPHRTPANSNRKEWEDAYAEQLSDIDRIIRSVVGDTYPGERLPSDAQTDNALSRLIYHCSSKYITPYQTVWDDDYD